MHPLKANLLICVTDDGISISSSDEQFLNEHCGIWVIKEGRMTDFNDLHSSKILAPIKTTDEGISICTSDSQFINAQSCIWVNEDGDSNVILLNDWQLINAFLLIFFTEEGMTISLRNWIYGNKFSFITVKDGWSLNDFNDTHSPNAYLFI